MRIEEIERLLNLYDTLKIVCIILAVALGCFLIFLFFYFQLGKLLGDVTGLSKKKALHKMQRSHGNDAGSTETVVLAEDDGSMETVVLSESQEDVNATDEKIVSTEVGITEVLSEENNSAPRKFEIIRSIVLLATQDTI